MVDPGKFARQTIGTRDQTWFIPFGLSCEGLAAELRRFADAIEDGTVLPQKIQTGTVATTEDYQMQAIMIEFAEKLPKE
jgi:hypothetical protein